MKYRAEIFDQIQWLFKAKGFNDHQLHSLFLFDRSLDLDLIRRAISVSIEAIPILGCRYVQGADPHWESTNPKEFDRALSVVQTQADLEQFIASPVDESLGPQLRVCAYAGQSFALAFKMNHMVCDAAGFKEYLYLLCETYTALMQNREHRPARVDGDRSLDCVLRRFSLSDKLKSIFLQSEHNNLSGEIRFPLSEGGQEQPFILTSALRPALVPALKGIGKRHGATLNDVILTAFYRSLFKQLSLSPGSVLQLPVMVDMRRSLDRAERFSALTNLSSRVNTELEYRLGETFAATLARVKATMDERKGSHPGIDSFVQLALLYRVFGGRLARYLVQRKLNNPYLCMTNIGILDEERLQFGGVRPQTAWMCGSIKYKPYVQLAVSTYAGAMTLSVSLAGNAGDRSRMQALLDMASEELSAAAS
jgi:NRPS condensation-like uncharacterized protein